jgi:phosphoribosylglycinamide formyltransferase-1
MLKWLIGNLQKIGCQYHVDGIILAGYLALIPEYLIDLFPDSILNIHPALLPAFGGKGMYGHYVHEAVSQSGHSETGITIHLVNKEYDKGKILFQSTIPIKPGEDPQIIANNVLKLEHANYSNVIWQYFSTRIQQ